jgi:hypothetical protein
MNDNLEQVLDECIERIRRDQSVADVLRSHPDHADELGPLLSIASDLEALPDPAASGEDVMRSFIKASAERKPTVGNKVRFFSRPFLLRAAAVLLVVFLGGWATVTASADAVPGDWLYPLKLFTERAKFFLTVNQEDKAELRIVFSSERLKEAVKKYQQTGVLDQQLLDQMLEEARLAAQTSEDLSGPSRSLLAAQAMHASEYQRQVLDGLRMKATSEHDQTLARYSDMCGRRAQWMREMCGWRYEPLQSGPAQEQGASPPQQQQQQDNSGNGRWRDRCPWW